MTGPGCESMSEWYRWRTAPRRLAIDLGAGITMSISSDGPLPPETRQALEQLGAAAAAMLASGSTPSSVGKKLEIRPEPAPLHEGFALVEPAPVTRREVVRAALHGMALDEEREARNYPACRVCGCTDDDCLGCFVRTGQSCCWVEADLCSACAPLPPGDAPFERVGT